MNNKKWYPYIKPTRKKHDSGYRMFEVGYICEDEKQKIVLGACSDHIWTGGDELSFNIDLLDNGCIRFHSFGRGLKWAGDYCLSSTTLELGWPEEDALIK